MYVYIHICVYLYMFLYLFISVFIQLFITYCELISCVFLPLLGSKGGGPGGVPYSTYIFIIYVYMCVCVYTYTCIYDIYMYR